MSKLIAAALAGAAIIAHQSQALAQEAKPAAEAPGAATSGKAGESLPPVVVQQKKPAADAPAAKPAPKKVVADDAPPPKPRKKVASKPKPAPAPAPAVAPAPPAEPAAAAEASASPATALGSYNPALDVRGLQLPPGTTLTTAGPVQGYRALSAMSSTKTATPIEQIPQSIQVVPRSVIEDQVALSVADAARNVSAVQPTNPLQTPAYDSTLIRGFPAEQWLDGMSVYYNVGARDSLANVERIEVLKGPSAILYGGGAGAPIGGALNVISKLPTNRAGGEIGVTFGSHNFAQPYFDINQPLNHSGSALFRVTGEYKYSESFIDDLKNQTYSINPTLVLTNKVDTTLTIQGRFNRWAGKEYQGLPAVGTVAGGFRIDRDLFIGPSNVPDSSSTANSITVTLDHKFNAYVDGSVKVRASKQEFAELAQSIVGADSFQANAPLAGSTWGLTNIYLAQEQSEVSINPNLRMRFNSGPSQNTLLFGADHSRLTDKALMTADAFIGGAGTVDLLTNPVFPTPYVRPDDTPFTTFDRAENLYVIDGAYAQAQTSLWSTVHLLAGVRFSRIQIDWIDPPAGAD